MNTGKSILGIVAGLATGTILGLLFAPEKGSDTRKKIIKRSADLSDAIDNRIDAKFAEYEQRLDELIDSLTGKMGTASNEKGGAAKTEHAK